MSIAKAQQMFTQLPLLIGFFRLRRGIAAICAVTVLSGCATPGASVGDRVGGLMVAPGKFTFYNCAHLAAQAVGFKARERELEALIAKAGPGAGGSVVSAVAYRPQYLQARANLIEVRKAEAEKNCPPSDVALAPAPPAPVESVKPKKR